MPAFSASAVRSIRPLCRSAGSSAISTFASTLSPLEASIAMVSDSLGEGVLAVVLGVVALEVVVLVPPVVVPVTMLCSPTRLVST